MCVYIYIYMYIYIYVCTRPGKSVHTLTPYIVGMQQISAFATVTHGLNLGSVGDL